MYDVALNVTMNNKKYATAAEPPISNVRQEMNACSVSDSVAVPGPPLVSTLGRSMILKASISRMRITVEVTGRICGQETFQNICQRLAPSTMAASSSSVGTLSRAAIRTMNMNGVHCQMSPIMTAARAPQG